jgi:hypothetical protein
MSDIDQEVLKFLRQFIATRHWQFAKTYAMTAPHQYTVRKWKPDEQADFEAFSQAITTCGKDEWWRNQKWRYLIVDGYKYWSIGDVINRAEEYE